MPTTKQAKAPAATPAGLREKAGLTPEQVAEHVNGVSADTLSRIEKGTPGATVRTIRRLAALYGCDPADLFNAYMAVMGSAA